MAATLTFYGAVDEIGGNKILLKTSDGALLLDFGRRMNEYGRFFSDYIQARSKNALRDMLRLGILPKIDGVYTRYLVDMTSLFENPEVSKKVPFEEARDYWKTTDVSPCDPAKPAVDAVFVTHAHFDHIQDVSFLDPCIPVYCTEKTKVLAKAMTDVSVSGVDDQYYKLAKESTIKQKPAGYKTLCPEECAFCEEKEEEHPIIVDAKTKFAFTYDIAPRYRTFNTDMQGHVKGIEYKLIPVGHSVPGACSILLTLPGGKRVLYTGDIRFHGADEVSIDDYVKAVGGSVDIMITEGTRVDSENVLTEEQVGRDITEDIRCCEGLVLINFGWKDLTRFNTVYEAAKSNGRVLVVTPKLAYLLYEMHCNFPTKHQDPRTMDNLKVYLKREGDLLYSKADYDKYKMGYLHYHGRNVAKDDRNLVRIAERLDVGGEAGNPKNPLGATCAGLPYDYKDIYSLATHHLDNGVRAYQIRRTPRQYVLMFSFWDANELFDLIPLDGKHQTRYISASTEPFSEEMEIDERKMVHWMDFFSIACDYDVDEKGDKSFKRRHVSGHASKMELKEVIDRINPARIIPIHTENCGVFESLFASKVILPKYAQPIEI
ncbi:MAG: MBL fold metallo-hydrolase [Candidatus Bathyarchaeota archaeon]|nr:MBL fold metallo-hydrolase [Candidatus Bathyarchaeota archaeon]